MVCGKGVKWSMRSPLGNGHGSNYCILAKELYGYGPTTQPGKLPFVEDC